MVRRPSSIRVRMYNVGFGDCFLITFEYGSGRDRRRSVLIDFGSNSRGDNAKPLHEIGAAIAADCGGKLAGLVVSHRHKDHLYGFDPGQAGEAIKALAPEVVLRPWTEEPGVDDETGSTLPPTEHRFARALRAGQESAATIDAAFGPQKGRSLLARVSVFAASQVKNFAAVQMLDRLSEGGRGRYLHYGIPVDLADVLPGVALTVLGPPLPSEWEPIRRQRADDPEYWLRLSDEVGSVAAEPADRSVAPPGPERWLIDGLERQGLRSTFRIVRTLDRALNNTSLILLIEAAGRRLLFPGDAQIENWSYCLTGQGGSEELRQRLAAIDLYKVGHHGSRNATPKLSLVPLWQRKRSPKADTTAMMSTLPGVYDDDRPVPSQALVDALSRRPLRLLRTDEFGAGEMFQDVVLPALAR